MFTKAHNDTNTEVLISP